MYAKKFRTAWSSAVVLVLAGCASLQVRTDYDQHASFAPLSTYEWIDQDAEAGGDPAVNSPLLQRHIRAAVDSELAKMGYRKATSGTPDFRIAYRVDAEERSRSVGSYGSTRGYGYRPYYYPGYFGFRFYGGRYFTPYYGYPSAGYAGTGHVREYMRGTLVLDVIDVRTDELIWRGWASKSLDLDPRPEKVRMYVDEAVAEILEEFPPTS